MLVRLEKLLTSDSELQRRAAVAALAAAGQKAQVFSVVGDRSPQVRGAVAEALARWSDRDAAATAGVLLQDASNDVLRRLFASLAVWPLPQAGPVLLSALDKPGYLARQTAAQSAGPLAAGGQLPRGSFGTTAGRSGGRLARAFPQTIRIRRCRRGGQHLCRRSEAGGCFGGKSPATRPVAASLRRSQSLAQPAGGRGAGSALLGTELIPGLDALDGGSQAALPEEVYRSVLPQHDASFAELQDLASGELSQRRRAAEAILARSVRRPLSELAIARLNTLLLKEGDEQVWCHVLAAVAADPGERPRCNWPTWRSAIRRSRCAAGRGAHLAAHPDGRHVKVLLPMLDDPDATVAAAAVAALSRQGKVTELAPLRRLLTSGNGTLRMEAAVALARLGDPTGRDAVERMVYHGDPAVRPRRRVTGRVGRPPKHRRVDRAVRRPARGVQGGDGKPDEAGGTKRGPERGGHLGEQPSAGAPLERMVCPAAGIGGQGVGIGADYSARA